MRLSTPSLSLDFDAALGMLRYLRAGQIELIRGVYVAVRDEHWGTASHHVSEILHEPTADGFRLSWRDQSGEVDWRCIIEASDTRVRFAAEGEVRQDFRTQRTGLCLLHPAKEARGAPCRVEHVEDGVTEGAFPDLISPHQPFKSIRSIRYEVAGISTEATFEGEVFEMEDQRNWSDASFKTYCRPHDWPSPYPLSQGDIVRHSVTITVSGELPKPQPLGPVEILVGARTFPLPELGRVDEEALFAPFTYRLMKDSLRIRNGDDLLWTGARGDLEMLAIEFPNLRFLVCDPSLAADLARTDLAPRIYPASHDNFTELNRSRPEGEVPGIAYATNAQVHAFDNASMVETLEGLSETLATAKSIAQNRPVRVGPVVLGRHEDPRVTGAFAHPWTLAALQRLSEGGASAVAFAQSDPLKIIAEATGLVRDVTSSDSLRAYALAIGDQVWLLNLFGEITEVSFDGQTYVLEPYEVRATSSSTQS